MQIEIRRSAYKDIDKITTAARSTIEASIVGITEVDALTEIRNLKKLKGSHSAYRIRVGDYRIGVVFENNTVIIMRILSRKDIYKFFP